MRVAHIALAAGTDGQQYVPSFLEQLAEALVLLACNGTVLVEVDLDETLRHRTAGQLVRLQFAVAVPVQTLDDGIEGLDLDAGARVAARGPARHVEPAIVPHRRRH